MLRFRYFLVLSFILIVTCLFVSCNLFISLLEKNELSIQPSNITIELGAGGFQYSALKKNMNDGSYEDVTANTEWSSSNRTVANISADGFVFPVSLGTITVHAEYQDLSDTTSLTITDASVPTVPPTDPTPEPSPGPSMDPLQPDWARSSIAAPNINRYNNVKTDGSGNIYACGMLSGSGIFNFGKEELPGNPPSENCLLIKYAPDGTVIWSITVQSGSNNSTFNSLVLDSNGNIYAAGGIYGTGTFDFGNGVTVSGKYTSGYNFLLVKYNSSGIAQWAKTVTNANNYSCFFGVDIDNSGNLYAAGYIKGNSSFMIESIPITGPSSSDNVLIVKYNINGTALWAKTVLTGTNSSQFTDILYNSANIYVTGYITGTSFFDFGCGTTIGQAINSNPILVKYAPDGTAVWSKTTTACANESKFNSLSGDSTGNIYVTGYIKTTGNYNFGCGIINAPSSGNNVVVVKYNSSGNALWARTVNTGSNYSGFNAVVYNAGCVYATGYIFTSAVFDFGCGPVIGPSSGNNAVLVKYDTDGNALAATSLSSAISESNFFGLASDPGGILYGAGFISGNSVFDFGYSVTVNGAYSGDNVILVRYWP